MAHTLTIPTDTNGMIYDATIVTGALAQAIAVDPFGFKDVFLYSHGWATNADTALNDYNAFSTGFARQVLIAQGVHQAPFTAPPREALSIGIHWPSEISENLGSALDRLELLTFFSMKHRADAVGENAVYSIVRRLLEGRKSEAGTRFLLLGHSFGSKVICAALEDLQVDVASGTIPLPEGTSWRVALLEPAMDQDNLELGDIYGNVNALVDLRLLITTSQRDTCLVKWYPDASRVGNFFHGGNPTPALGAAGPTNKTIADFKGGVTELHVDRDFGISASAAARTRVVVADLTPIHAARVEAGQYAADKWSGSHSDLDFPEMYNLVSGFLFS